MLRVSEMESQLYAKSVPAFRIQSSEGRGVSGTSPAQLPTLCAAAEQLLQVRNLIPHGPRAQISMDSVLGPGRERGR